MIKIQYLKSNLYFYFNTPFIKTALHILHTYYWHIVVSLHLVLLFCLYQTFGLNTSQEGYKYLVEADYLIHGNFQKAFEHQSFYAIYIIYLAFFKLLHLPYILIFITNYALSWLGYYCFYKLIKQQIGIAQSNIWMMLMALSPLIQYWQFNLFSETFFIAITLIFTYALFYNNIKHRLPKIILLSIILMLSKPTGIFTVGVLLSLYALMHKLVSKKVIIMIGLGIGTILFFLVVFTIPLHYNGYAKEIMRGSIYCGFPTLSTPILPRGNYSLWQCYQNIYQNHGVGMIIELFIKKVNSFLGLTRPYYTTFHNLINALHYLFYFLGLYGIYKSLKQKSFENNIYKSFILIILLNAFLIGMIFNEWSERYTVVIFPFIFLFASGGILILFKLIRSKFAI